MDLDKIEEQLNKLQKWDKVFLKKAVKTTINLGISSILFSFVAYIFLNIYKALGFEPTLIILLIGIFYINWAKGGFFE